MRSCIYCGRDLEKGEVCNCAGATARRNASQSTSNSESTTNDTKNQYYNNNSYQTGYTRRENPIKRAWQKRRARSAARRRSYDPNASKRFGSDLWRFIKSFVISPVDTVSNPGYISKGIALAVAMLCGAIINICLYFLRTGAVRSPFGIILSLIALNPVNGYSNLMYIALSAVSGAISGILIFFIYSGVFFIIDRFIFRHRTAFWHFAPRFALTPIPLALASIIGILFGMLSSTTLAILIICGIIGMVVLTYEALKTEWISAPNGKVVYAMMLGYFIFTTIICYIIRLS